MKLSQIIMQGNCSQAQAERLKASATTVFETLEKNSIVVDFITVKLDDRDMVVHTSATEAAVAKVLETIGGKLRSTGMRNLIRLTDGANVSVSNTGKVSPA